MNWQTLQNESISSVITWAESQPWCEAMSKCEQDAQWHAEGDVWTHTQLVLHELQELDDWPYLTPHEQTVLTFTALFHDIAKPLTTEVDPMTGRVTSPKHAVKGEHIARAILRELECDLATREQIARLVRYHGRPAFLLERPDPTLEVIRLSWLLNNRLLYLFAIADTRGRDTDAMGRPEENLHFLKLVAEEIGCFNCPFPFANDHARFLFFRHVKPDRHYIPHEDYSCQVTLMSGLPGSGKDTWLQHNRGELPVVSLDDLRNELGTSPTDDQGQVVQLARERCREHLRSSRSFAFNATNIMAQTRKRWVDLFHDYKARVEIVYLEPPLKQVLRQNKSRPSSVPEDVIQRLALKCEPPTWFESHSLIVDDCR